MDAAPLIVLAILWLVGLPIVCLILAARANAWAGRAEADLGFLRREVSRLAAELGRGKRGGEPVSGSEQPQPAAAPPPPPEAVVSAAPIRASEPGGAPVSPAPASGAASAVRERAAAEAAQVLAAASGAVPPTATAVGGTAAGGGPPPLVPPAPVGMGASLLAVLSAGLPRPAIDWERFMGVKLFAWVGGFALFLAVAFFVKYSFENNLISPQLRVASGFLAGVGLLVGGVFLKRKAYEVTSQTLCATGVVILYAVTFACRSYYEFTDLPTTFALMVLVTVTAFTIAVRLSALVVAVLGLVGGFLTPPLLSTGVDNPLGLFGYVAILDLGLAAVALRRRWYFLVGLGALGTVLTQVGWAASFFAVEKAGIALGIFLTFNLLFLGAFAVAERYRVGSPGSGYWLSGPAVALPLVTFGFVLWLLRFAELGARPGLVFGFLLVADLPLLAAVLLRHQMRLAHVAAGTGTFVVLAAWTTGHLTTGLLYWALGGCVGLAVLHAVFPVVLERWRPGVAPVWWGHLFPLLALLLASLPLFKAVEVSALYWPVVMLINGVVVALALLTGALVAVTGAVLLTAGIGVVWLFQAPRELGAWPELLLVAGGCALFFFGAGLWAGGRILARAEGREGEAAGGLGAALPSWMRPAGGRAEVLAQVPALGSILPFVILMLAVARLPLEDPSPVFGVALLLVAAFVRLGLNPAVFEYYPRSATPIFNWLLYTYGLVTASLFVGARLLAAPRDRWAGVKVPPVLYTLGTVLAFFLVNLEIADYFATDSVLRLEFTGNFARDMTYSIAWAVFALVLLAVGVWRRQRAVRYAALALLSVAVLKLFFQDLVRLQALYRIGAFFGVALVSILASVLYQRFFAGTNRESTTAEPAGGAAAPAKDAE